MHGEIGDKRWHMPFYLVEILPYGVAIKIGIRDDCDLSSRWLVDHGLDSTNTSESFDSINTEAMSDEKRTSNTTHKSALRKPSQP